ncbi:hypothetical protein Tco_1182760 [Tanacetum coccineum]
MLIWLSRKAVGQNQKCKMKATGQQHTKQPEIITEGRVDQYTEKCQVKSPMIDSSLDNKTIEFSNHSLKNIRLKKIVAQFQKDFSRMEAHYKIETISIELEHSVAKLLKENETLKKHYKDLYDSIKITRSKTIEQTTSLLANNADLKAQIQEKVFAIAALKNDLRKLKGNSVDTKFAKTSVLGKPVLQSQRNQSVVRQPNAFKSERPQMSKPRFASQVDVDKDLSKPVTQYYLPKGKESAFAKLHHMIASSLPRNSSKNMPRYNSNDMVHNYYLEEAKKRTQERNKNLKSSVDPSGKILTSCTSKDDSEPTHVSNVDIPNIHECKQTLDLSAGTSLTGQQKQIIDFSAELESLFNPLFDEDFSGENQVVSKSFAVTTVDASDKRQQQPYSTSSTSTPATTVIVDGNFDLYMTRRENSRIFTPFQARKGIMPLSVHNIYSFYESESFESVFEEMGEVDIETLTMEQYLGLVRSNQRSGIMRSEIRRNTTKRWMGRVPAGIVNSWDLLKRVIILRYCPPSRTAKQLEEIRHFRQEGLEIPTHRMLDSRGPIPGMTDTGALVAIQQMDDYS